MVYDKVAMVMALMTGITISSTGKVMGKRKKSDGDYVSKTECNIIM